jgi:Phasin protein
MSTTQRDKPTAKQRQRNRKADQRNQKSEQQATARPDQGQTSPIVAPAEAEPVAIVAAEEAGPVAMMASEEVTEAASSGEVLVPDVRDTTPALNVVNLQTVAQAYGDYTRKSWQANRFLVERLTKARSFDEAIEIQGEFAKQAYANFLAQSQKIGELYGELAKQFFRPFDKVATGWTRIGR